VKGDIHDIGKNIVATLLRAVRVTTFKDLGWTYPGGFRGQGKGDGGLLLALSGLLTLAFDADEGDGGHPGRGRGMRDKVK